MEAKPSRPTRVPRKKLADPPARPEPSAEQQAATMNPVDFTPKPANKYAPQEKVGDGPKIGDPPAGLVTKPGLGNLKVTTNYGNNHV